MATGDLTTLAAVKEWLPETGSTNDSVLTRLITAVSTYVQSWLNRTIAEANYNETRNGQGNQVLSLFNYPVMSVSALTISGLSIPSRAALGAGTSAMISPWGFTFGAQQIYLTGYEFTRGFQNINVAYTAGYATTPPDVEQATIDIISQWFKTQRGDKVGIKSMSIESQNIAFDRAAMTSGAKDILQQYRRVVPLAP